MNKTLYFKGKIKTDTAIIDPNLPKGLKKQWVATGALVRDALKHAYLNMVVKNTPEKLLSLDEAYLILSGKMPIMRQKRVQVGSNYLLAKHDTALGLFGSHSHGIEGRLKVGFISCPDEEGFCLHSMQIVHATSEDVHLILSIINEWSKGCYLGEKTELGYGRIQIKWDLTMNNEFIGNIFLSQGESSADIESIKDKIAC